MKRLINLILLLSLFGCASDKFKEGDCVTENSRSLITLNIIRVSEITDDFYIFSFFSNPYMFLKIPKNQAELTFRSIKCPE